MKTQKINWKRWLLIPFLCILLVLAGGCGKSGAADKGQDEEQQELQQELRLQKLRKKQLKKQRRKQRKKPEKNQHRYQTLR